MSSNLTMYLLRVKIQAAAHALHTNSPHQNVNTSVKYQHVQVYQHPNNNQKHKILINGVVANTALCYIVWFVRNSSERFREIHNLFRCIYSNNFNWHRSKCKKIGSNRIERFSFYKRKMMLIFGISWTQELIWWSLKIICIVMMVLCNVFVWTFFVKALHQPGGSIVATVTATATNYCCSVDIQTHFCEEAKFGQKHQIKVTLIFFRRQLETGYLTSTSQCCGGLVPLLLWLVSCLCH